MLSSLYLVSSARVVHKCAADPKQLCSLLCVHVYLQLDGRLSDCWISATSFCNLKAHLVATASPFSRTLVISADNWVLEGLLKVCLNAITQAIVWCVWFLQPDWFACLFSQIQSPHLFVLSWPTDHWHLAKVIQVRPERWSHFQVSNFRSSGDFRSFPLLSARNDNALSWRSRHKLSCELLSHELQVPSGTSE